MTVRYRNVHLITLIIITTDHCMWMTC